jgi:hypothetical protein
MPNARHEPSDIGEGFVWGAVASMLGLLIASALLVVWLYPQSRLDRTLNLPLAVYPAPRLQANPRRDMQSFHDAQLRYLSSYGWVDQGRGIVHIPIADAMAKVAADGIPQWPTTPAESR